MSGLKLRAASRAAALGFLAKQRSRKRTLCPAASSADATHARPLGTTGYGCRSRFVLTRSTRAPPSLPTTVLPCMTSTFPIARAAYERSKATKAPTPEQTAFTASLSKPATPPACRVGVPQSCTRRSVGFAHTSHQRRACNCGSQGGNLPERPPFRPVPQRRTEPASWPASPRRRRTALLPLRRSCRAGSLRRKSRAELSSPRLSRRARHRRECRLPSPTYQPPTPRARLCRPPAKRGMGRRCNRARPIA